MWHDLGFMTWITNMQRGSIWDHFLVWAGYVCWFHIYQFEYIEILITSNLVSSTCSPTATPIIQESECYNQTATYQTMPHYQHQAYHDHRVLRRTAPARHTREGEPNKLIRYKVAERWDDMQRLETRSNTWLWVCCVLSCVWKSFMKGKRRKIMAT